MNYCKLLSCTEDSDKPTSGFDKRTIASDIYQLIQSLGFSTIFLVGHDYGGSIAYVFAAEYPMLVQRLVVIECAPAGLGETNSIRWRDVASCLSPSSRLT